MAAKAQINRYTAKPKNKLRRHTKHKNKHKSTKPYKGQGR